MNEKIDFFLNGKPASAESPLSVRKLLEMAGVSPDAFCIETPDNVLHCAPDQSISLRSGDKLGIKRKPPAQPVRLHYKVNGEDQTTTTNPLSLETILRQAGADASIDASDLGVYYLENLADGAKYESLADLIIIKDGDQFVAIHTGATPVA